MNQHHEPAAGLLSLMNRKRANQIQPSIATAVKTNNNSNNTLPPKQQQHQQGGFPPIETYYTVPNLRSLIDRALPSLPPSTEDVASAAATTTTSTTSTAQTTPRSNANDKKVANMRQQQQRLNQQIHTRLQRAVTWLGTPLHKLLSTSIELPLMYNVNHGHLQQQASNSKRSLYGETDEKIYCKVHQIVNYASSREYEYHLHLQLNGDTIETVPGIMQKMPAGSARGYPDRDILLDVNGSFDLTFILTAQPLNTFTSTLTRIKHRLGRSDSKQQVKKDGTARKKVTMPVIGVKQIVSGSCLRAFVGQGPLRYTLTQPLRDDDKDRFNLELTVSFHFDKNDDINSPRSMTSCSFTTSTITTVNSRGTGDNSRSDTSRQVLDYCQQGDCLTIYVRGQSYPTWRRYMVKLKAHMLLLLDESYKIAGSIPLKPLRSVTYASENDQELVRMSGATGLVLKFDRTCAKIMEPARLEDNEVLEGKVYLYADNTASAEHWKQLFDIYAENQQKEKTCDNIDNRINLRFMW